MAVTGVLIVLAVVLWPRRPSPTTSRSPAERSAGEGPADEVSSGGRVVGGLPPGKAPHPWGLEWRVHRRKTLAGHETQQVLDLLDVLAPALRAGLAPGDALRAVPDLSPGTQGTHLARQGRSVVLGRASTDEGGSLRAELRSAADRGEPLGPVWRRLAQELGSTDVALVASAWSLCERLGSPLAPTISTVSRVVRQRQAAQRRLDVATAGPRASMLVLTVLPAAGPLVALVVGIPPADLYATPAGGAALGVGVLLLGAGRWWCGRLIGSVRPSSDAPRRPPDVALGIGDRSG